MLLKSKIFKSTFGFNLKEKPFKFIRPNVLVRNDGWIEKPSGKPHLDKKFIYLEFNDGKSTWYDRSTRKWYKPIYKIGLIINRYFPWHSKIGNWSRKKITHEY